MLTLHPHQRWKGNSVRSGRHFVLKIFQNFAIISPLQPVYHETVGLDEDVMLQRLLHSQQVAVDGLSLVSKISENISDAYQPT